MTRAPRLSARMRALNEAAAIAEERARLCRDAEAKYEREGAVRIFIATERSAALEAELITRLIRERMQNRRAR
jgi:hypothetical protein